MPEEITNSLESKRVSTTFRGILHFPHSIDASLAKQRVYDGKGAATSLNLGGGNTGADLDGPVLISGNTTLQSNLNLSGNANINGNIILNNGGNINDITVGSNGSEVTTRMTNTIEAGKLRIRESQAGDDYEIIFGDPTNISTPNLFSIKVGKDSGNNFYIKHRPSDFDSLSPFWINQTTGEVNIKNLKVSNLTTTPNTPNNLPPGNQPADSKRNYIPPGCILMFPSLVVPVGWFECDGREVDLNDYPELFSVLEYKYSTVTSGNLFRVPDLRGLFVRGLDRDTTSSGGSVATGRDPISNRDLNNVQQDELKAHTHTYKSKTNSYNPVFNGWAGTADTGMWDFGTGSTGGDETRPKNMALVYCIKW